MKKNIDGKTVRSFGKEWKRFHHSNLDDYEFEKIFKDYFKLFPLKKFNKNFEIFDMGCGTGRWAFKLAPFVRKINCIDPSESLKIAKKNLKIYDNVEYFQHSADTPCLPDMSQDFGYSLGVLHHVPDTQKALNSCVKYLKKDAPFLLYIYYNFDNKPLWYKSIWQISSVFRFLICRLPSLLKNLVCDMIALIVYYPLAKLSLFLEKININVENIPLSFYRKHSVYVMRTDALDRFGTPLEKRFSKSQILEMMKTSGLKKIKFSDSIPYWCAIGYKE